MQMLQKIVSYMFYAIAEAMELFIGLFGSWLSLDISDYMTYFPVLGTAYTVFRGLALGLVAVIAALSLMEFYQPAVLGGREETDTPAGILMKAMFAAGLVFGGNYILEEIIRISKIPYDNFLNQDAVSGISLDFSAKSLANLMANVALERAGLMHGVEFLELLVAGIIAWNLLKLIVEVCERYMMVGVLLFTSPPFFAMFASKDTMHSFKKWIKMFVSACAMMMVSMFFLKMILSGFSLMMNGNAFGPEVLGKMLLMVAVCKIAMRADAYLAQIGLGAANTGGNLLDDIVVAASSLGRVGRNTGGSGAGGSKNSVLGKAATAMQMGGGLSGNIVNGVRAAKSAAESGADANGILAKIQDARKSYDPQGRHLYKAAGKAVSDGVRKMTGSAPRTDAQASDSGSEEKT